MNKPAFKGKNLSGTYKNQFKKSGKPYIDLTRVVEEASGVSLNGQKVWMTPNTTKRPDKKDPDFNVVLMPAMQGQASPQRPPPPPKQDDPWGSDDEIPF